MYTRDSFAIVSWTPQEEIDRANAANKSSVHTWKSEPQPLVSFLSNGTTPWNLKEAIWDWLEPRLDEVDPWDVTVLSCDILWDPWEIVACQDPDEHDDLMQNGDYEEHRWCGSCGADRVDYAAEMSSYAEEYLGGMTEHEAAQYIGWTVNEILGIEGSLPGVDFFNVHYGPFPVWEASLYGGVLISKEAS